MGVNRNKARVLLVHYGIKGRTVRRCLWVMMMMQDLAYVLLSFLDCGSICFSI